MKFISESCNVISMDEAYRIYHSGLDYPVNAVAVTFDDGFKNNYTVAAPILKEYNIPAAFYVCSGVINTTMMFWVDMLEDAINLSEKEKITIFLDKEIIFNISDNFNKFLSYTYIKDYCKKVKKNKKDKIVQSVIKETGVEPSVDHATNYLKLSWDELMKMDRDPLFTIGGHSMYHDILTRFDSDDKTFMDLDLSIRLLEYNLGHKIFHYSYPEGQNDHYNMKVITKLKELSIRVCPSAIDGINDISVDLFNLKRIMVGFNKKPFPILNFYEDG
ncbi:peptidoglycan/xylan/chitin deacetylase (PgdA/CDA1 family) [Methanocalculus sp. AMF5]|uniref:polysaccharide deacetylase family protein n=1 Tax=Methanocalculus sp. AMF5 TaxID=1198257 RepID=UPI00209D41C4|nr:polysaccharide deacetylase family protein [Methanocalculus sp. AMF5]MCP1663264.1 peptidoglycan/xylan/chitin deacetylase (PgdA/CDA1 family) [Methanocalculus sp. AMF5]